MHEIMKIKQKGGIEWSYRPWERKTLQKFWRKMTKNCRESLPSRREKKSWKTFWKGCFWNSQRIVLKKPEIRSSIDRKISIDQKIDWINRNSGKNSFWEEKKLIFEILSQSIESKKKICLSMRWNVLPKHRF